MTEVIQTDTAASSLAAGVSTLGTMVNDLRRITDVGFAEVHGELRLLNERVRSVDDKWVDAKESRAKLDERIKLVERDYVTRKSVYTMLGLLTMVLGTALAVVAALRL